MMVEDQLILNVQSLLTKELKALALDVEIFGEVENNE